MRTKKEAMTQLLEDALVYIESISEYGLTHSEKKALDNAWDNVDKVIQNYLKEDTDDK